MTSIIEVAKFAVDNAEIKVSITGLAMDAAYTVMCQSQPAYYQETAATVAHANTTGSDYRRARSRWFEAIEHLDEVCDVYKKLVIVGDDD